MAEELQTIEKFERKRKREKQTLTKFEKRAMDAVVAEVEKKFSVMQQIVKDLYDMKIYTMNLDNRIKLLEKKAGIE